jgi:AcrR family transcriptional regulator
LYAHFPDERSLFLACSGLVVERDPMPDAWAWGSVADRRERLRAGLRAIYDWYERNAGLAACVLRDGEYHALTKEMNDLRFEPHMRTCREVLGAALSPEQRAVLRVMLGFFAWRSLLRESGLEQEAAVGVAVQAIEGAGRGPTGTKMEVQCGPMPRPVVV